jgi:hypothetical protein
MVRVRKVTPLDGFTLRLEFTDGSERTLDMEPYLKGPIFEPLKRDIALFRSVRVDEELGTIVWPNGADVCPDVLVHGRTPVALETSPARRSG